MVLNNVKIVITLYVVLVLIPAQIVIFLVIPVVKHVIFKVNV